MQQDDELNKIDEMAENQRRIFTHLKRLYEQFRNAQASGDKNTVYALAAELRQAAAEWDRLGVMLDELANVYHRKAKQAQKRTQLSRRAN